MRGALSGGLGGMFMWDCEKKSVNNILLWWWYERVVSLCPLYIDHISDMLPPLKSLILKWGLLAQWLYWAKYLQAILACPAILLPGHGHFFIFPLSGYGQFMLSTSFSPLRGCWLLHYDLCPSYFHTHSDRLQVGNCWCVCIAYHGRIIPACCIVNYL